MISLETEVKKRHRDYYFVNESEGYLCSQNATADISKVVLRTEYGRGEAEYKYSNDGNDVKTHKVGFQFDQFIPDEEDWNYYPRRTACLWYLGEGEQSPSSSFQVSLVLLNLSDNNNFVNIETLFFVRVTIITNVLSSEKLKRIIDYFVYKSELFLL